MSTSTNAVPNSATNGSDLAPTAEPTAKSETPTTMPTVLAATSLPTLSSTQPPANETTKNDDSNDDFELKIGTVPMSTPSTVPTVAASQPTSAGDDRPLAVPTVSPSLPSTSSPSLEATTLSSMPTEAPSLAQDPQDTTPSPTRGKKRKSPPPTMEEPATDGQPTNSEDTTTAPTLASQASDPPTIVPSAADSKPADTTQDGGDNTNNEGLSATDDIGGDTYSSFTYVVGGVLLIALSYVLFTKFCSFGASSSGISEYSRLPNADADIEMSLAQRGSRPGANQDDWDDWDGEGGDNDAELAAAIQRSLADQPVENIARQASSPSPHSGTLSISKSGSGKDTKDPNKTKIDNVKRVCVFFCTVV